MKNLLKNKKGFSLAEILLVVAIVVILSGATMIGIASMVNRSQAAASRAVANNANFEADAVLKVNKKKGMVNNEPFETETLNTGNAEGGETNNNNNTNNSNNSNNSNTNNPVNTTQGSSESSSESTTESTTAAQGGGSHEIEHNGSGGSSPSFTTTTGTHWDANDTRDNPWGSHVPDVTSQGSVSFGSTPVSSFTISVTGKVMEYSCNDWRYSITDNNDGTYTISYTANQYEYNPPISSVALTFKVDGEKAADIKVTKYTEYKP